MSFCNEELLKSSGSNLDCVTMVGARRWFIECGSLDGLADSRRLRCELAAEYGAVVADGLRWLPQTGDFVGEVE